MGGARIADVQKVMAALASPIRREILRLVWDRAVPAGEIAAAFDVTKPTISQHLSVLRDANLVTVTAAGTSRLYRAQHDVLRGMSRVLDSSTKWSVAEDLPERSLSEALTKPVVVARATVSTDQVTTFRAFTEADFYSRWLGVPVTIDDGRFACTMEWGTNIRGRYEIVHPPQLIVMRWDFEDDNVPVPGGERTAYLRVTPAGQGASVEVHQMVDDQSEAEFMEVAWTMVLGRLTAGVVRASDPAAAAPVRPRRTKRRRSA